MWHGCNIDYLSGGDKKTANENINTFPLSNVADGRSAEHEQPQVSFYIAIIYFVIHGKCF